VGTVSASASFASSLRAKTVYPVLGAISFCHFLNDLMQSLLPAIYPLLKSSFHLDFAQVGLITFTNQAVASLLQPVVGLYTDRHPRPYSLAVGMGMTLIGLLLLASAATFGWILLAVAMVGVGSSIFHPESSRVARMASGGQHGLAQSLFQVGGNAGSAAGPLLAAFVILPHGQSSLRWFSLVALLGMIVLARIGTWARDHRAERAKARGGKPDQAKPPLPSKTVIFSVGVLLALIFSKFVYMASLTSYYTFYLIHKFNVSVREAQIYLFVFLGAVALGTILGGPIGDRLGRKYVIWASILGVLPFTVSMPYVNLFWTVVFSAIAGMILSSAFPAIIVYAQELMPGRVGMISGLFFGLAFGIGGLGAAMLGKLADATSIDVVYRTGAFLPALGLLAGLLPNLAEKSKT